MSNIKDFFKSKREWSETKDGLLACYLVPYFQKIKQLNKKVVCIDCFAGKGIFEDGTAGSPLIICKLIEEGLIKKNFLNVEVLLIESKFAQELSNNVLNYGFASVLDTDYEIAFEKNVLAQSNENAIFIYVDPFGIKNLSFQKFEKISDKMFKSVEILMNFNAFGFLRQACNVMRTAWKETEEGIDYEDEESADEEKLNLIANGEYWKDIVRDYKNGVKTMKQCEDEFVKIYLSQIQQEFKYVINIPIKAKSENIPKYRMIFMTNHIDGIFLMCDNMNKRWKEEVDKFTNGQITLLPILPLYEPVSTDILTNSIVERIKNEKIINYNTLIYELIRIYGCSYSRSEINKILKELQKDEYIKIKSPISLNEKRLSGQGYKTEKYTIIAQDKIMI